MLSMESERLLNVLWNYHHLNHNVKKAEAVILMGSQDLGVPKRAAELYKGGIADTFVCSGGFGKVTRKLWKKPESEVFKEELVRLGVPEEKILQEPNSTNCGENITFSMKILKKLRPTIDNILLVQKPYHERRAYATFKKQFPRLNVKVTSEDVLLREYLARFDNADLIVNLIVGDTQRITKYAEHGFQIKQEVPLTVQNAFNILVEKGYNQQLLKD